MENAHYASLEDYVDAVADALRTEYEAHRSRPASCSRSTRPTWRWSATRCSPTGRSTSSCASSSTRRRRARTARSRACRASGCGCTSAGATTRRRTSSTCRSRTILPRVLEARVGGARALDGEPAPRPRASRARAPRLPDGLAARRRRDRHDHELRRAPRGRRRAHRAGGGGAVGDPHRVLAGTDCGFDTAAGLGEVAEEVVWEKLRALRAGADLATKRLL